MPRFPHQKSKSCFPRCLQLSSSEIKEAPQPEQVSPSPTKGARDQASPCFLHPSLPAIRGESACSESQVASPAVLHQQVSREGQALGPGLPSPTGERVNSAQLLPRQLCPFNHNITICLGSSRTNFIVPSTPVHVHLEMLILAFLHKPYSVFIS